MFLMFFLVTVTSSQDDWFVRMARFDQVYQPMVNEACGWGRVEGWETPGCKPQAIPYGKFIKVRKEAMRFFGLEEKK